MKKRILIIIIFLLIFITEWCFTKALADDNSVVPVDVVVGEKIFKKMCGACHTFTKNKVGPSLENIIGEKAGSVEGYKYSRSLKDSEIIWNVCNLDKFLTNPKKYIKGTKMSFKGVKKQSYRDAIIVYLKENQIKVDHTND